MDIMPALKPADDYGGCVVALLLFGVSAAGWINHLLVCIAEERWVFLGVGALLWPIGIIHGIGRFFGWW